MILSCKVYAISKQGIIIEQLGSSFGFLLVLFSMKISAGHTHSGQGKSPVRGP